MRGFRDRRDAGERLAQALQDYADSPDTVVLALPRGGVPVGFVIAEMLGLPLDVLVVRKLGVPGHTELAMGAIASGGIQVVDRGTIAMLGVSDEAFAEVVETERIELERRERMFRGDRPALEITGKTVIVVDDGLATGATMMAAIEALRARDPTAIIVAVPVAPPETCNAIRPRVDDLICLATPEPFRAVGLWYRDFSQTTDGEVWQLLDEAARAHKVHTRSATETAAHPPGGSHAQR